VAQEARRGCISSWMLLVVTWVMEQGYQQQ
jgi:hypothetical protein